MLSSYTPEASDLQVGSLVLINSLYDNVGALRAIPSEKPLFLEAYPIQLLPIIYVKDVLLKKTRQNCFFVVEEKNIVLCLFPHTNKYQYMKKKKTIGKMENVIHTDGHI